MTNNPSINSIHYFFIGNRVFRHQHWESRQLYQTLREANLDQSIPIVGLYSSGSFTTKMIAHKVGASLTSAAVM